MPSFSVIVPVYNVGPYLPECLASVKAQDFRDWECLCVDDGSRDDSGGVLDEVVRRDGRFRIFHRPNRGVSCARNTALREVAGEYVTFLDADDVVAPDWLNNYVRGFRSTGVDLLRIGLTSWEGGYPLVWTRGSSCQTYVEPMLSFWGAQTFCRHGFACAYAVRRACVADMAFPPGMAYKEDVIFSLHLLQCLTKASQTEYNGYFYRQRAGSAIHVLRTSSSCLRVLDELILLKQNAMFCNSLWIRTELAWNGWTDICGWAVRPRDRDQRKAIRTRFAGLRHNVPMRSLLHGRWHWIPAYVLYNAFGIIWPIRVTRAVLGMAERCLRR